MLIGLYDADANAELGHRGQPGSAAAELEKSPHLQLQGIGTLGMKFRQKLHHNKCKLQQPWQGPGVPLVTSSVILRQLLIGLYKSYCNAFAESGHGVHLAPLQLV